MVYFIGTWGNIRSRVPEGFIVKPSRVEYAVIQPMISDRFTQWGGGGRPGLCKVAPLGLNMVVTASFWRAGKGRNAGD